MKPPISDREGDGRVPPGQVVTQKFPVLTAGTPKVTPAERWTMTLSVEASDGAITDLATWDYGGFRALPQTEWTRDIHCVTRWSKLDTQWRGVRIEDLLAAAPSIENADPDWPIAYARAECDGEYSTNLRLQDLTGDQAMIALDYDGAPLAEAHGGPARLLVPKLYFWKSAKWIRRLVLSPFDRKGFWERLGYHNYGDPWREQRYRGVDDSDHRRTLDPELSRQVREERKAAKRVSTNTDADNKNGAD